VDDAAGDAVDGDAVDGVAGEALGELLSNGCISN
jgi:hypothetical protein